MPGSPRTPESKKRTRENGDSDHTTEDGSGYDTDPPSPYDLKKEERFIEEEEEKRRRKILKTPPRSSGNRDTPDSAKTEDGGDTYTYIKPNDTSEGNILRFEYAAAPVNAGKIYYDAEGTKFKFDKYIGDVVEYEEPSGKSGGKSKRRKSKRTKKQKKSKRRRTTKRRYKNKR